MSGISSFINRDLLFNLSNSDLENLIFNYRVCHLARISLMMLLPSSRTRNSKYCQQPALTHIGSSIQIRAPTEKISHFLCLSCIRVLSSSWNKMSWQRNFCKIYFLRGRVVRTVHSKLLRIININFASRPPGITCWGNVLF